MVREQYDIWWFCCAAEADLHSGQVASGSRKRGTSSTAAARLASAETVRKAPRPAPVARPQRGPARSPSQPAVVAPRRTQAARQRHASQSAAERRIPRASARSASAPSAAPSLHATPPGMSKRAQETPAQSARACAPQAEPNPPGLVVRASPEAAESDVPRPDVMTRAAVETDQPAASSETPEAPTEVHATEDTAAPPSTRPASPHSGQSMSVAPTVVHSCGAPDAPPTGAIASEGAVAALATTFAPDLFAGLASVLPRNAVGDSSGQSAPQLATGTRPTTAVQPPQQLPTVASQAAAQLSAMPQAGGVALQAEGAAYFSVLAESQRATAEQVGRLRAQLEQREAALSAAQQEAATAAGLRAELAASQQAEQIAKDKAMAEQVSKDQARAELAVSQQAKLAAQLAERFADDKAMAEQASKENAMAELAVAEQEVASARTAERGALRQAVDERKRAMDWEAHAVQLASRLARAESLLRPNRATSRHVMESTQGQAAVVQGMSLAAEEPSAACPPLSGNGAGDGDRGGRGDDGRGGGPGSDGDSGGSLDAGVDCADAAIMAAGAEYLARMRLMARSGGANFGTGTEAAGMGGGGPSRAAGQAAAGNLL
jgi:hypothetical protein